MRNAELIFDAVARAALAREVALLAGATHDWYLQPNGGSLRLREHLSIIGSSLGLETLWFRRGLGCQLASVGDAKIADRWPTRRSAREEIAELVALAADPDARFLVVIDGIENLVPGSPEPATRDSADVRDLIQQIAVDSRYTVGGSVVVLVEHVGRVDDRLRTAPGVRPVQLPLPADEERAAFIAAFAQGVGLGSLDVEVQRILVRDSAGLRLDELHPVLVVAATGGIAFESRAVLGARTLRLSNCGLRLRVERPGVNAASVSTQIRRQVEQAMCAPTSEQLLLLEMSLNDRAHVATAEAIVAILGLPAVTVNHPFGIGGLDESAVRRIAALRPRAILVERPLTPDLATVVAMRTLRDLGCIVVGFVETATAVSAFGGVLISGSVDAGSRIRGVSAVE